MNKARIVAYRASRITRDYTFTDELLDAYEKLEKEDAHTAEVLANTHAAHVKAQAKLSEVEQEREDFMLQAAWAINILNAPDVPKEEQDACNETLRLERERLDFYRNGKKLAEMKLGFAIKALKLAQRELGNIAEYSGSGGNFPLHEAYTAVNEVLSDMEN